MDRTFEGRRIAIAGGCGGIGRAVVDALASRGAHVFVLDLEASIERHPVPEGVRALAMDGSNSKSVGQAVAQIEIEVGGLDGLVNLIGYSVERQPIEAYTDALWQDVIGGNLDSAFYVARAAMPLLRSGKTSSLVNVSSGLALKCVPGYGGYPVAKAGVMALTRLLAQEAAPHVRANCIAPSAVETAFLTGGTGRGGEAPGRQVALDVDAYLKTVPLARLAQPDDIVGPVLFLLSNASAYVTGQTLHVNGGTLMV